MPQDALPPIARPLLQWYDQNARILPWRGNPSPYRVWISEIMLQQTRVSAVIPYFERFVAELPTVRALAEVPEERLLKLWEGLGYYNRARNLQRAAVLLMEQSGGRLPEDPLELQKLPGIGRYTAGAVASIAYGVRVPAVDGNVLRVVSRLLASAQDVSSPKVKKWMEQLVLQAIPPERAGDFNQALMELGAVVCLPNGGPRCGQCPLKRLCRGCESGTAAGLPVMAPKKQRRVEEKTVFVIVCGDKAALRRRPSGGLLPGLWEFPNEDGRLSPDQCGAVLNSWGVSFASVEPLRRATHVFTHVEWHMQAVLVRARDCSGENLVWADCARFSDCALPSAFRAFEDALPWRHGLENP